MSLKDPSVLVVDRLPLRNDYRAYIHPEKLGELKLKNNAIVELISDQTSLLCRVAAVENCCQFGFIQISRAMRINLGVSLGESIEIRPVRRTKPAECVVFAPISDTIQNISGTYSDILFNSGIEFEGLPISQGQIFPVFWLNRVIEFKVVITSPDEQVVIRDSEVIACRNTTVKRKKEPHFSTVSWDDIGGIDNEILRIRQTIELPLMQPRIFKKLDMTKVRNLLLVAPAGCGKSMIGDAIRSETSARFVMVKCMDLLAISVEKAIAQILKTTEEAVSHQPSIVFYDDLDSVAAPELTEDGEVDSRISNALTSAMKRMKAEKGVVVISTTRDEGRIRRDIKTKIDYKIEIGLPNEEQRLSVLKAVSVNYNMKNSTLQMLSAMNIGKSCAVLAAECQHTLLNSIARLVMNLDKDEDDGLTINQIRKVCGECEESQRPGNMFEDCDFDHPEVYVVQPRQDNDLLGMEQGQGDGREKERTFYDELAEPREVTVDEPIVVVDYFQNQTPYSTNFEDDEVSDDDRNGDSDDGNKRRKRRQSYDSYSDSYYYSGSYYSDDEYDYDYDRPKKRRLSGAKRRRSSRRDDDSYDEERGSGRRAKRDRGGKRFDGEGEKKRRKSGHKQKESEFPQRKPQQTTPQDDEPEEYNPFAQKTEQQRRNPFGKASDGKEERRPSVPVKRRDPFGSYQDDDEDGEKKENSAAPGRRGSIQKRDPFANAESAEQKKPTPKEENKAPAKRRNPFEDDAGKQPPPKRRDPFADKGDEVSPNKEAKVAEFSGKKRSPFEDEDVPRKVNKRDPFARDGQETTKKEEAKGELVRKKRNPFGDEEAEQAKKQPGKVANKTEGDVIRKKRDPFASNDDEGAPKKGSGKQSVAPRRRDPFGEAGDSDEDESPKKKGKRVSAKPVGKRRDRFASKDESDEDEDSPKKPQKKSDTKQAQPKRRDPFASKDESDEDEDSPKKPQKKSDTKQAQPKRRDPFAKDDSDEDEVQKETGKKPDRKSLGSARRRDPFASNEDSEEDDSPKRPQKKSDGKGAVASKKRSPFAENDDSDYDEVPKRTGKKDVKSGPAKRRDPFASHDDSDEEESPRKPQKKSETKASAVPKKRDPFASRDDSDDEDLQRKPQKKPETKSGAPQKKRDPFASNEDEDEVPRKPQKKSETKPAAAPKKRDPFASRDDSDDDSSKKSQKKPETKSGASQKKRDPFASKDDSDEDEEEVPKKPQKTSEAKAGAPPKKRDPFASKDDSDDEVPKKPQKKSTSKSGASQKKRDPFASKDDSDEDNSTDDNSDKPRHKQNPQKRKNPFSNDSDSDGKPSPGSTKPKRRDPFASNDDSDSDHDSRPRPKRRDPFA